MKRKIAPVLCALTLSGALIAGAQPEPQTQTAPDNTAANKKDRSTDAPNADRAKNNTSDRELMANIRRDIVKDKSLSTYAHNVKIVSSNGKVTLRGPVRSDQEKSTVEELAKKYAGDQNVTSELTVKPESK